MTENKIKFFYNNLFYHNRKIIFNDGRTLIEMMVAIVIFIFILGGLYMTLQSGNRFWGTESNTIYMHREARLGMMKILNELPQGGATTVMGVPTNGVPVNAITFRKSIGIFSGSIIWSPTVEYLLSGTTPNQLLRRSGGVDTVLANDVKTFEILRSVGQPRTVEILLETEKITSDGTTYTADLSTHVQLRN